MPDTIGGVRNAVDRPLPVFRAEGSFADASFTAGHHGDRIYSSYRRWVYVHAANGTREGNG